jgi:hypothetical protein
MALRDAFSRFLRGKAQSKRDSDDTGGSGPGTVLNDLADNVESGDDPELVVLVERLEGFYDPDTDEFIPTGVALEIIEGFDDADPKELVRQLGDAAPASDEASGTQTTGDQATGGTTTTAGTGSA